MKFSELQLNDQVLDALEAMRFDECTPIQEKSIPVILEGRDLIAVAQTGTGKTAAYLLPVLNKLSEGNHPEDAINCIVMSPTRELAQQIDQQMEGFSYFMPVSSVAVSYTHLSIHNLAFYLWLVGEARKHIIAGDFSTWKPMMVKRVSTRL